MARQEQDREDLLREATALVERVQLSVVGYDASVFFGFRHDGCSSIYIDQDPAYHFNSAGELRRAFVDGRLFKAEHGQLVSMVRNRIEGEVQLVRRDLSDAEASDFMTRMKAHLSHIGQSLADGGFTLVGKVPDDVDVVARASDWLEQFPDEVTVAQSPRAL